MKLQVCTLTASWSNGRPKAKNRATVNLDMIALHNVLKRAIDDGLLKSLPMENLRPLKVDQRNRPLVTAEQFEKLFSAAASL
jgi:hypothetical protein